MGHTCNYAVVVAQLYTKGQCHGIHPFIVQLRDEETHMPLPGELPSDSIYLAHIADDRNTYLHV